MSLPSSSKVYSLKLIDADEEGFCVFSVSLLEIEMGSVLLFVVGENKGSLPLFRVSVC